MIVSDSLEGRKYSSATTLVVIVTMIRYEYNDDNTFIVKNYHCMKSIM